MTRIILLKGGVLWYDFFGKCDSKSYGSREGQLSEVIEAATRSVEGFLARFEKISASLLCLHGGGMHKPPTLIAQPHQASGLGLQMS